MRVFLSGPLADLSALRAAAAPELTAERAAELAGYQTVWDPATGMVGLAETPGARVPGYLAEASAADLARLDYLAAAGGLTAATADPNGAAVRIWTAPLTAGTVPWAGADWPEGEAQIALPLALDILALQGQVPAPEVARRLNSMRARVWSRLLAARGKPITRPGLPARHAEATALRPSHFGFFRMDTFQIRMPRFDGELGPALDREVKVALDAALVLPYDPVRDEVVLVEQFRVGLWRRGDPAPWSLEPIAGMIDPGETPAQAARREAREEAGLTLTDLERIAGVYASPGYNTDYFHCFLALCDIPDLQGRIGGLETEAEHIRAHRFGFAQAMAMVDSGEIDICPLVMMLNWLARHRARLRRGLAAGASPQ